MKRLLFAIVLLNGVNLFAGNFSTEERRNVYIQDEEGSKVQIKPDGTKIIERSDGSFIQVNPDQSKLIMKPDGTSIQIKADGTKVIKKADGTQIETRD